MIKQLTQLKRGLVMGILALGALASMAQAEPFTKAAFDQAIANKQPVLVDVYADWCSTCAKQQAIIKDYFKQHPDSKLKVLTVDFDNQKKWVSYFKAPRQSTLVGFKGGEQVWFSVAQTKPAEMIKALSALEQ